MNDSIFTRIIKGEIPCHKVYEDETSFAFLDIHPINPGHILLIPKKEVDHLWELDDETYHHLWDVAKVLSGRIQSTLAPPRVGIVVEGFGVAHAHIHIIPLHKGNDIKKHQDTESTPDHDALGVIAEKLSIL